MDEDPNTNDRLYLWDIVCRLPTNEECSPGRDRPMLPPKAVDDARPTLVLDLDETLVHSGFVDSRSDITLRFEYDGAECAIGVRFRPHLFPFLKFVSDRFEVVVFTAAEKPYAERVLDRLDPYGRFFSHRLYRDSCVAVGGKLFKDLSALGRDLARTAILDDSPISYGFQLDNAVPITPWRGEPTDASLRSLVGFLRVLARDADLRPRLERTFGLREYVARRAERTRSTERK